MVLLMQEKVLDPGQIEFYAKEGYLILERLLSESEVDRLRSEVLSVLRQVSQGQSKLHQTTQYQRGGEIDALVNNAAVLGLAEQLMGGPSTLYMPFAAVKSGGGGGQFHFHQDNQYTEFDGPGINLWFALEEMTTQNGCLQIVPGSHLEGTLPSITSGDGDHHKKITGESVDCKPMLAQAGDCIAFTRLTVHGSGPNVSGRDRAAYAVQFHRDDVRMRAPDNDWRLLKDNPRWCVGPLDDIQPGVRNRVFE